MGATALSASPWTRRKAIALGLVPMGLGPVGFVASRAAAEPAGILVVSRKRMLNETAHARALLKAEIALTAELQKRVDQIKAELTAEEQELARLRPTLEREVFDARVAEFDRKIRSERRAAQKQGADLQNIFRAERLKLVEAMGPLLEEVRAAHGASVILNLDQTLTSDPALDVTDELIALFNANVPAPVFPKFEALFPTQLPVSPTEPDGEPPPQ